MIVVLNSHEMVHIFLPFQQVPELPEIYSLELRTLVQDMMSQEPEARPSAKEIVQNDLLLYHRVR